MTQEEFDKKQEDILTCIPEEFHSFVRMNAWDRGHSAGLDEVFNIEYELVKQLENPIYNYKEFVKQNYCIFKEIK